MILVIVLVAFRLANPASLAELHALPKTFVCDEAERTCPVELLLINVEHHSKWDI